MLTSMAKALSSLTARLVRLGPALGRQPASSTGCVHYSSSIMADIVNPRETIIKKKLSETFKPTVLQIVNESYKHNVPKGSETHFKVIVVSETFEGVPLVQRHRHVNTTLEEEFATGLHALSIVAKTPSQWDKSSQEVESSPPCRGGAGL